MKFGHTVKHNGVIYPAGTEVPTGVELVDEKDVPEGALNTNEDGSVPAFNEGGTSAGTADAETVKQAEEAAGEKLDTEKESKKAKGK